MIDVSNAKWDFSAEEKYVAAWLEENGFTWKLERQYVSKTKFIVHKNGVSDTFDLVQGVKGMNMKSYMTQFLRNFDMLCELDGLRKQMQRMENA